MINLYKILGVKKTSKKATIKKAYYKLSKLNHPDTGGDAEKFDLINKAYQILSNPEKRVRYDKGESIDNMLSVKRINEGILIISDIFVQLMEKVNPETDNIIKMIDESIDLNISNVNKEILKFTCSIQKYKTFLKKLKYKNKKNILMEHIAIGHIANKRIKLELFKKKKVNLEKAKELIKDFDYDIIEEIKINLSGFGGFTTSYFY